MVEKGGISMIPAQSMAVITRDSMGLWYRDNERSLLTTPLVTDEILASAYIGFKRDGLVDRIWNQSPPSLTEFLTDYHPSKGVQTLAFLSEVDGRLRPCGLAWICGKTKIANVLTKAEVGEAFARKTSPKDTLWFGRMAIDFCFDELELDAVYGTTAEPNRAAVRYARSIGMKLFGPIDSYTTWKNKATGEYEPCGTYISVMTKERWAQRDWR